MPNNEYYTLVEKEARAAGVSPALARGVMSAESSQNPKAVSPKGAQGLMQLMPDTAKRFGVADPFDPQQNVRGGIKYLAELQKRFAGDQDKVLAAYNAGEGAVDSHGGVPPYPETHEYIERVNKNMAEDSKVQPVGIVDSRGERHVFPPGTDLKDAAQRAEDYVKSHPAKATTEPAAPESAPAQAPSLLEMMQNRPTDEGGNVIPPQGVGEKLSANSLLQRAARPHSASDLALLAPGIRGPGTESAFGAPGEATGKVLKVAAGGVEGGLGKVAGAAAQYPRLAAGVGGAAVGGHYGGLTGAAIGGIGGVMTGEVMHSPAAALRLFLKLAGKAAPEAEAAAGATSGAALRLAPEAAKAAEKLILSPEDAAVAEQLAKIAKLKAAEQGMKYAAYGKSGTP